MLGFVRMLQEEAALAVLGEMGGAPGPGPGPGPGRAGPRLGPGWALAWASPHPGQAQA